MGVSKKVNVLFFIGVVAVFLLLLATDAKAEVIHPQPFSEELLFHAIAEFNASIENTPEPGHVFNDVHSLIDPAQMPPEWIARIAIHELRINQILYRDGIIRVLLARNEFQIFQNIYEEKLNFLNMALTQRHLIAESDITNLVDSTISLQEFILLQSINQNLENGSGGIDTGFKHWTLALQALLAGIAAAIIMAIVWVKQ